MDVIASSRTERCMKPPDGIRTAPITSPIRTSVRTTTIRYLAESRPWY
jgi:hypothetical protein